MLEQRPFLHILFSSLHSLMSSRMTVCGFGWKPTPPGQTRSNSGVPGSGHFSQSGPHAVPTEQQQADLGPSSPSGLPQTLWPVLVTLKSE